MVERRQSVEQVIGTVPVGALAVRDIDNAVVLRPGVARKTHVEPVERRLAPPGRRQAGARQRPELEHVLDAVAPVADAFVAGPIRPQRCLRAAELLRHHSDPLGGLHARFRIIGQRIPRRREAARIHPQMVLQERGAPRGRREHDRAAADQRAPYGLARVRIEIAVEPVVDQRQPEQLVPRRQVLPIPVPQPPMRITARGQRPLLRRGEVLLLARQQVRHRQIRQLVADLALPELLIARRVLHLQTPAAATPQRNPPAA